MQPIVTIGVCVRNGEKLLGEALSSITKQDFPSELIQTIIVDDGSEDNTFNIIQAYRQKLGTNAKIFKTEWRGLGSARQTVVNNACGKYIIWVDCDMRLSRDFVRQQVEFMNTNPKVGIGKGMYGHGIDHKTVAVLENMEFLIDFKAKGLTNTKSLGTSGCIYRLEALHEIHGFDTNIKGAGEDMDAEYRIRERGWELFVTDAVFYEKRRDTWRSLWDEYYWHGCGLQPLLNKSSDRVNITKIFPPIAILQELMRVPQAYKLTKQRVAILLPAHYAYKRIAWILGFIASRKSKKSVR